MTDPFPPIEQLVPHRYRMLFIDRIVASSGGTLLCSAVVRDDNPFLANGRLLEHALVEYMAQAMAGFVGLKNREEGDPGQNEGFLVSAKDVELAGEPVGPGDELSIHARLEIRTAEYGRFTGEVMLGERRIARGRLSFYHAAGPGNGRGEAS